jgi:hypothetical protein
MMMTCMYKSQHQCPRHLAISFPGLCLIRRLDTVDLDRERKEDESLASSFLPSLSLSLFH